MWNSRWESPGTIQIHLQTFDNFLKLLTLFPKHQLHMLISKNNAVAVDWIGESFDASVSLSFSRILASHFTFT